MRIFAERKKKQGIMEAKKRSSEIIRTSLVGVGANVLLAAFKAVAGAVAGSVAIIMDAVNNLSDALSSVITIIGAKLSQRPADLEHPFGHGRIEYFSAIIIAVIVLAAGCSSLIESLRKLFHPTLPSYTTITLVVIIVAIVVKLALGLYVGRQGRRLQSDALVASGADALFDAFITFSTLLSALVMLLWDVSLDGLLGVLISCLIIKAGIDMLSSPINQLLGSRVSPELVAAIKKEVMAFPEVHGVYDIILHSYGPDIMIGSLHISVLDTLSAHDIHRLTRRISEHLMASQNIVMTVGVYAIATGDNKHTQVQNMVLQTLSRHKEILQVHGFCYFDDEHRVSVDVVPDISVTDEARFAQQLTAELQTLLPDERITVVIDHNFSL